MKESIFQRKVIEEIEERLPGCIVMKNDATCRQGFPDLTVYYQGKYAWLETKKAKNSSKRPNQEFYISKGNSDGAFSSFIYPENKEEVINAMERSLKA